MLLHKTLQSFPVSLSEVEFDTSGRKRRLDHVGLIADISNSQVSLGVSQNFLPP